MLADQTLCIEIQQGGATNALLGAGPPASKAKVKFPGQESLPALYQALGDDKARLLQRVEHMGEYAGDGCHTTHFIEGVLEVRITCVIAVESLQVARGQLFVQLDKPLNCSSNIG